ncbi:hypothetical protein GTO27_04880, partial [Candidatus Bathyarchaeota archaeon]|nr:hypothetical protein [Candidatus Bathyarchaeota archaeon]
MFDEAIEDFTLAANLETDEMRKSMILYQRGYAKRLSGDFKGAWRDATRALELDRRNNKARVLKESVRPLL